MQQVFAGVQLGGLFSQHTNAKSLNTCDGLTFENSMVHI